MDTEAFLNNLGLGGRLKWGLLIVVPAFFAGMAVAYWRDTGTLNQKDATLSQKEATIQTLEEQIRGYKDKLNGATPEEAQKKIADLETRLARVEPRKLSEDQRRAIYDVLSQKPDSQILLSSDMSCADCGAFTADFRGVLDSARWGTVPSSVLGAANASPKGIAVETLNPSRPSPEAESLMRALGQAKIPYDLRARAPDPSGALPATGLLITARAS
jgi:hypothetical protein